MASVLPLDGDEIGLDHLAHEVLEARLVSPAELLARLRWIAVQPVDFGRSARSGLDSDHPLARLGVAPLLARALALPFDPPPGLRERELHELADGMGLAGREHVVIWLRLLQHQPHALDVVAR